jgi:hypothetical protein
MTFRAARIHAAPEIGAISMSGSSMLVEVDALSLKRLRLPRVTAGVSDNGKNG